MPSDEYDDKPVITCNVYTLPMMCSLHLIFSHAIFQHSNYIFVVPESFVVWSLEMSLNLSHIKEIALLPCNLTTWICVLGNVVVL